MNSTSETDAPDVFAQAWAKMSSISFVRLKVPTGHYQGITIPAWSIGLINKAYSSSICEFGDARIEKRVVYAGEVTVVPPNTPFRSVTTSPSEIEYLVLTQACFENALRKQHLDDVNKLYSGAPIFASHTSAVMLSSLFMSKSDLATYDSHHAANYVNAIISDVVRSRTKPASSLSHKDRHLSSDKIRQVTEFVDANIEKPLTNGCIAQLLNMSETTFGRLFTATTGQSPYQFVLDRRVECAKNLLTTTTLPIAQIAHRCGFSSQSHFTSTLKRRVGATPKGIRDSVEIRH